jgi:hypothetical protein
MKTEQITSPSTPHRPTVPSRAHRADTPDVHRFPPTTVTVTIAVLIVALVVGLATFLLAPTAGPSNPTAEVESLYTPEELRLLEAVRSGQVPAETIDTDAFRLKKLANEGLIPREAAR